MLSKNVNLSKFNDLVATKFQLYNSLFTSLPFHKIEKTGIYISLLLLCCQEGFANNLSPEEVIDSFFNTHLNSKTELEKKDLLFKFVQYVERQVVLFDAIEDAAFTGVNDMNGKGTLKDLILKINEQKTDDILIKAFEDFKVKLVLTAHPTQFYTNNILSIINDLANAISKNNESQIFSYLKQLGITPFFNKKKPTPYDEANGLIWYLENVFYHAFGKLMNNLKDAFPNSFLNNNAIISLGFWPGGDRDGNPFVVTEGTVKVANALRGSIIKCYYQEVRKLKKRLTFKIVDVVLAELENKLFNNLFVPNYVLDFDKNYLIDKLQFIKQTLIDLHGGFYVDLVDSLLNKVELFGLYFASLDIRQESSIHGDVLKAIDINNSILPVNYDLLSDIEKMDFLFSMKNSINTSNENDISNETIKSIKAIKHIQEQNGELGCNRYIISMCNRAYNVAEVFALFVIAGWDINDISVDIVPLFETIHDLDNATVIMDALYKNTTYKKHLKYRNNTQTIMLGFSDGTKDGGYFTANWSIYKAKQQLTQLAKTHDIDVVFFDGRGGPPARGGGKTHKFYASFDNTIANKEVQLTIQGQTISSNFGSVDSAQYNVEQLLNAGLSNKLFNTNKINFTKPQEAIINTISSTSLDAYLQLKNHSNFIAYLQHTSPLTLYTETNIGSRPAKRGAKSTLALSDLRAIPFVGAWSQLKQNVTGYYGVGTALKKLEDNGQWEDMKALYHQSSFLKTLFDNCEMAMMKCYFPLTAYLKDHPQFGEIWKMIEAEFNLTTNYILKLSGKTQLMENYPIETMSIQMREKIMLPLVTIQQYALTKIRNTTIHQDQSEIDDFKKLAMRCSFGIINAGRNSV